MSDYQTFTTCPVYVQFPVADEDKNLPDVPKWSGKQAPPRLGARVKINFNSLGTAVVTGYFVEDGFLGLLTRLENAPEWHRKQNKNDPLAHVFGIEFSEIA